VQEKKGADKIMKIMKKIEEVRQKVISGDIDPNDLAKDGIEAIFAGMQRPLGTATPEWEKLMRHFVNDDKELDRLCGKEPSFNGSRWGLACIAYIAGNSVCTSETATVTGTSRSMSLEMIKNLDAEENLNLAHFDNDDTKAAYTNAFKNAGDK